MIRYQGEWFEDPPLLPGHVVGGGNVLNYVNQAPYTCPGEH